MNTPHVSTLIASACLLAACAGTPPAPRAVATIEPTRGNAAAGSVGFEARGDRTLVSVKLSGLKPNSEHGFHIHEKGDCSSGDGLSAGGHFNPLGHVHGPQEAEHHAGDLPALKADAEGRVQTSFAVQGLTIGQGATDIVGHGLIVHAAPDDYRTQPTGNSGARIGCAAIRPA
ncbi:MAG: superoxide dismutase family protein [Burkholderiales bacterium]